MAIEYSSFDMVHHVHEIEGLYVLFPPLVLQEDEVNLFFLLLMEEI